MLPVRVSMASPAGIFGEQLIELGTCEPREIEKILNGKIRERKVPKSVGNGVLTIRQNNCELFGRQTNFLTPDILPGSLQRFIDIVKRKVKVTEVSPCFRQWKIEGKMAGYL